MACSHVDKASETLSKFAWLVSRFAADPLGCRLRVLIESLRACRHCEKKS